MFFFYSIGLYTSVRYTRISFCITNTNINFKTFVVALIVFGATALAEAGSPLLLSSYLDSAGAALMKSTLFALLSLMYAADPLGDKSNVSAD